MDLFNRQGIFNRTIKAIPAAKPVLLFDCCPETYIGIHVIDVDFAVQNRKIDPTRSASLSSKLHV